jgi:hypothetical protein
MINLTQNNIDKLKNLEHLMEKLPKTADGVIITPGMTVYGSWEGTGIIHAVYSDGLRVKQDGGMFYRLANEVYSKIKEKIPVLIESDIVEFIYNDERQVVLVMNQQSTFDFINTHIVVQNFVNTHVVVWNFAKQEMQTYLRSVITSVRLLNKEEYKKIIISDLPDTLQSPGDLCLDYENMGWSCYCKDGIIIAVKIKKNQEKTTETKQLETKQLEIIKKAVQKFFDGVGYEEWKDKPNQGVCVLLRDSQNHHLGLNNFKYLYDILKTLHLQ